MLQVNDNKWNDNAPSLRYQTLAAVHSRTRECVRYWDEITQGKMQP